MIRHGARQRIDPFNSIESVHRATRGSRTPSVSEAARVLGLYVDTGFMRESDADAMRYLERAVGPDAVRVAGAGALSALGIPVATGRFGASMAVELVNDGPFTIWQTIQDAKAKQAQDHAAA